MRSILREEQKKKGEKTRYDCRYRDVPPKENNDNSFNISMPDIKRKRIINIQNPILNIKQGDYFLSSIDILKKLGFNFHRGYDVIITGDIPVNAGLSSSSALVVAWIRFLIQIQILEPNF